MTNQEAIKQIRENIALISDLDCTEYEMAISALEKGIPKKVKNRKILRDFHKTPYAIRGNCPICGSEGLLSSNTDYCNACGQKLDWSDED